MKTHIELRHGWTDAFIQHITVPIRDNEREPLWIDKEKGICRHQQRIQNIGLQIREEGEHNCVKITEFQFTVSDIEKLYHKIQEINSQVTEEIIDEEF